MRIIFLAIIGIILTSCSESKWIELSPIEPYEYIENNVIFRVGRENTWIYFKSNSFDELPKIRFSGTLETIENIENVYLKSITIKIDELNLILTKDDIMLLIPNRSNDFSESNYHFWSYFDIYAFETIELLHRYNQNLSLDNFFQIFDKVKHIEICITIIYTINNENKISTITRKYKTRKITMPAWMLAMLQ